MKCEMYDKCDLRKKQGWMGCVGKTCDLSDSSQSTGSVLVDTDKKHYGRCRGMPYDCPVCNSAIGAQDKFCAECGAKLAFAE